MLGLGQKSRDHGLRSGRLFVDAELASGIIRPKPNSSSVERSTLLSLSLRASTLQACLSAALSISCGCPVSPAILAVADPNRDDVQDERSELD
jgi:hypothetical protein